MRFPEHLEVKFVRGVLLTDVNLACMICRAACLVDGLATTPSSVAALLGGLSELAGTEGVALLIHEPSGQLFVLNARLTLSNCRSLLGEDHLRVPDRWFVDVNCSASAGQVLPSPPKSLLTLTQRVCNGLAQSESATITLQASSDTMAEVEAAREGVALAGLLLEYPCIYTFGEVGGTSGDLGGGNNLSDASLRLFAVGLEVSGEDAGTAMQFTIPEAAISTSPSPQSLPSPSQLERQLIDMFESRLRQQQIHGRVHVSATPVRLPLVGL